jgi:N-acetylmuramate 1-kinase
MNVTVELITSSEAQTCRLANDLSNYARAGDFLGLTGDLGAGKSVFARAFLRALADNSELEVPSPTFTLLQTYEDSRIPAAHFDLYRILDSTEVDELGLEDALIDGLVLIEWPERIDENLFIDRLIITIDDISPTQRKITLSGHGTWQYRLNRWQSGNDFLHRAGWGTAHRKFLQGDASHRRYERIEEKDRHCVLMDMPRMSDGPVIRAGKPYSALAHLAEGVEPFIAMTKTLQQLDLSAPQIFASQPEDGFLLLEDLGPQVYFDMAARGEDMTAPMRAAIDVLVHLSARFNHPQCTKNLDALSLPAYDRAALQIEVELLPDWYWPRLKNTTIAPAEHAEFLELWQPLWQHLEEGPRICALRDYHSPNLIWMPQRTGIARVGLLDYQDAVWGHPAYDLMSLLQDARRDVPQEVEAEMYTYYWQALAHTDVEYDREDFDLAYAILGAQRATKILGIFARLAERDHKPAYLAHMPRVRAYLERNLHHPYLKPLKQWFDRHLPQGP